MDPQHFSADLPGKLTRIPEDAWAFVPTRLPVGIGLGGKIPFLIEQASIALGRLAERAHQLPNPDLIVEPLLRKEAELSSRIEGTIATQEELALSAMPELEKTQRPEVKEVRNYVEALRYGFDSLNQLPLCLRLIRDLHQRLMQGVRGQEQRPGEFRTIQNQVSRPGQHISEARYVPPPPPEMQICLDAFERDLNRPDALPRLVKAALIHYQFEAIHPFRDGNGRVGRMLIPLFLAQCGLLPYPVLHISAYFQEHRSEYADLLLRVSQKGDFEAWVEFFLLGLSLESNRSIALCSKLLNLRTKYVQAVQRKRASSLLPRIIDFLFAAPILTIPLAAKIGGITYAAAKPIVGKLEDANIVVPITGSRNVRAWKADEIIRLLSE